MAQWKKVIVSGSNAELNQITGSTLLLTDISSSNITTPLVIDSNGNVSTGSAYALASGGNTVGGSSLASNIAIIGAGGSLIQTASSAQNTDFNSANVKGITQLTSSKAIFDSIALSGSFGDNGSSAEIFSIQFNSTESANLTIPSTNLDGLTLATPVTMSNVPGGTSETKVLMLGTDGRIVTRSSSDIGGVTSVTGLDNISTDSTTNVINVSLNDNISLTSITASSGIFFSSSGVGPKNYRIDYEKVFSGSSDELELSSGSLTITASGIKVQGDLDADGNISLDGTLSFNGFNFTEESIGASSGSTIFGSGSIGEDVSLTSHQFTGSILVTGSLIELVSGSFKGDGSQLTGIIADNVALKSLGFGDGLNGTDTSYNGTSFATMSIKLDGSTLTTSSAGIKVADASIDTTQLKDGSVTSAKLNSSLISDISTNLTDFTTVGDNDELAISDDGTLKKISASVLVKYISQSLTSTFVSTDTTYSLTATHSLISESVGGNDASGSLIRLTDSFGTITDIQISGSSNEIEVTLNDTNNALTFGLPDNVTIGNNLDVTTNLSVGGNATITGDLNVLGNTTTISTQDLVVEDRFIVIGSGSDNSYDVGLIFDSGSTNTSNRAFYYDASTKRFATAKNVDHVTDPQTINEATTDFTGDIVTVKANQTTAPSSSASSSFGEGEMYIHNGDIYIYID